MDDCDWVAQMAAAAMSRDRRFARRGRRALLRKIKRWAEDPIDTGILRVLSLALCGCEAAAAGHWRRAAEAFAGADAETRLGEEFEQGRLAASCRALADLCRPRGSRWVREVRRGLRQNGAEWLAAAQLLGMVRVPDAAWTEVMYGIMAIQDAEDVQAEAVA